MTLHHSAKPPEDLAESRAIRFFFRGDTDILECLVGWDALERLENAELTSRADRMARFEQHRPRIEAAALRKFERTPATDGPVTLGAQDVVSGPAA
ncbi:DUF1488 family protein [Ancylobacter dichloromethanicus]|uniref:DUF1488 family protein n=1 Tax=Ancylobacter dichloromethanicus TaxID=518825 RepID=A0A9W6J7V7_9HYPH|nr:DUF1488 family protein [Ancylobacter dichloromethanicus]MBS7554326.1 DUF1488 family protein [Ancylobacter dichloromethanicus]GLK71451.1 hypothetical protein GCM10017643_15660 [Ancylobacter dichloromethanicus]